MLEAEKSDTIDARSGPTDYHNAKLSHPIVASAHIGFTCSSCSEVKRIAEMAKEEGILEHGPFQEGWPGGYCAYITDPNGHSVEISYNQEAGYNVASTPSAILRRSRTHTRTATNCGKIDTDNKRFGIFAAK